MFLGTYEPRLDEKGRLILPAKYRDQLSGGLVITKGQEHCLYIYPMDTFQVVMKRLLQAPATMKEARSYTRVFLSGASDQILDKQGRINIPAGLREYAALTRDVSVIGSGDHAEIWDRDAWERYLNGNEESFADREEELIPGVF